MKGTAKGSGNTQVNTLNMLLNISELLEQAKHNLTTISPMLELDERPRFEQMRANLSTMYDDLTELYEANIETALALRDKERSEND